MFPDGGRSSPASSGREVIVEGVVAQSVSPTGNPYGLEGGVRGRRRHATTLSRIAVAVLGCSARVHGDCAPGQVPIRFGL